MRRIRFSGEQIIAPCRFSRPVAGLGPVHKPSVSDARIAELKAKFGDKAVSEAKLAWALENEPPADARAGRRHDQIGCVEEYFRKKLKRRSS